MNLVRLDVPSCHVWFASLTLRERKEALILNLVSRSSRPKLPHSAVGAIHAPELDPRQSFAGCGGKPVFGIQFRHECPPECKIVVATAGRPTVSRGAAGPPR